MAVKIVLKHSATEDKRPTPGQLENGEIALNYNAAGAFLTCKDTDGNIQQVGGVKISEVAPDSPVKQTLWFQPSSLTLFVYDGNAFLPVAGGGGGGTPGSGITTIIGNNGIDASEVAGVVTLDVELAGGDDGLEFSASKLKASIASDSQLGSVKIGDGIDVAGDGTISVDIPQALTFKGSVDLNNPPTGQVELPSAPGDAYVNSATANPVDNGWVGIGGDVAQAGDLVVWDGSQWEIIGTGGTPDVDLGYTPAADQGTVTNSAGDDAVIPVAIASDSNATPATAGVAGLFTGEEKEKLAGIEDGATNEGTNDGRYLRKDAAAGDQTVLSTGTTTFDGLTEHGGGVKVTGGSLADVVGGWAGSSTGTRLTGVIESTNKLEIRKNYIHINGSSGGGDYQALGLNGNIEGVSNSGSSEGFSVRGTFTNTATTTATSYNSRLTIGAGLSISNAKHFNAVDGIFTGTANDQYGFYVDKLAGATRNYGFYGEIEADGTNNYNFYAAGTASNFFKGDTYIGGTTARNTRELWESLLTEEQKEELAAGTLVVPANVSTPGDGEFARQWWYDQQSAEDQALIDSGELEYPSYLQAANFVDTFDLGDNTTINLLSNGRGEFKGGVKVTGGTPAGVGTGITGTDNVILSFVVNQSNQASLLPDFGFSVDKSKEGSISFASNYTAQVGLAASGAVDEWNVFHGIRNGDGNNGSVSKLYIYHANQTLTDFADTTVGFLSNLKIGSGTNYNFLALFDAPNFFQGNTYIGGTTARNTRELWESLLTDEQKEELAAGTLVVPANVATPGDGEYVRQWWYEQQSAEDQALIDAGELDYPSHLQAANFVDTFALGDSTNINLLATGAAYFKGAIKGGGVNAANNNWIIRADGSTSGLTVTRAAVVTDEQAGTVETLLDIITDLRARVEALEAAATS